MASAAQAAAGSGRPEPIPRWQEPSIFSLIGERLASAQRRILVVVYEFGRAALEVRRYPMPRGARLGAKIALGDGLVLGLASSPLSGLGVNHEPDIDTQDPHAVAAYGSRFNAD